MQNENINEKQAIKIHSSAIVDERVFRTAESFHIAAIAIFNTNELENRGYPFVTNASFALELYMKSFNSCKYFSEEKSHQIAGDPHKGTNITIYTKVYSKSNAFGHNLIKLYNKLPRNVIFDIESQANTHNISARDFFETHKDCFAQWRYSFEGNATTFATSHALILLEILRGIGINSLNKM